MPEADVGIIGAGLAGSLAAAMLGRAGISAVVIDPHQPYPQDFRCEKIDKRQFSLLTKTGFASTFLKSATPIPELWVAHFGQIIKRPNDEYSLAYQDFVNAVRAEIPSRIPFIRGRVSSLSTSDDRQVITVSNGSSYSVRLAILATASNNNILQQLGISRDDVSVCHSVSIGFDMKPKDRAAFAFPALTYFADRPESRIGYVTFFPIGSTMRANVFIYRDIRDPWLRTFRETPQAALFAALPRLQEIVGDFDVTSKIDIRPTNLKVARGHQQPGVVLVGDAFSVSCPASGTGLTKVLVDVERLCNTYIAHWLASEGMSREKIAGFYRDHKKCASDADAARRGNYMRSLTLEPGFLWHVRRVGWFVLRITAGFFYRIRARLSGLRPTMPNVPSAASVFDFIRLRN